jgi:hypothetical protein
MTSMFIVSKLLHLIYLTVASDAAPSAAGRYPTASSANSAAGATPLQER